MAMPLSRGTEGSATPASGPPDGPVAAKPCTSTEGQKRRPKPPNTLSLVSANISSWNAGWGPIVAAAAERRCDIICMQETRITADKGRSARGLARAVGWTLHLSTASRTGMRGPAPGGVAIAIRTCRGSAPMEAGPAAKMAKEGRLAACIVEGGPKNGTMALATVYLDPTPSAEEDNDARIIACLA